MKAAIAVALLVFSATTVAEDTKGPAMPDWMTGAWSNSDGEKWSEEYWTSPRAGIMLGASRSGRAEKLGLWEHLRITREADGSLVLWAIAGDQKPVRFVAAVAKANEIAFENAAHDYPQRIRYWREGAMLKAEISLIDGSNAVPFSFMAVGATAAAK